MSVVWFPGIGFRPSISAHHRADQSDRQHVTPEPDVAYLSKFDWTAPPLTHPLTADGWVLDPLPINATPHALATPGGAGPSHGGFPVAGGDLIGCCTIGRPDRPGTPGVTIPEPLPPIAPVPVPASAGFLIVALVMVAVIKRKAR